MGAGPVDTRDKPVAALRGGGSVFGEDVHTNITRGGFASSIILVGMPQPGWHLTRIFEGRRVFEHKATQVARAWGRGASHRTTMIQTDKESVVGDLCCLFEEVKYRGLGS